MLAGSLIFMANTPGNSQIKTVVFDLGKVLVDFDYSIAVRKLAKRARMTVADFAQYFTHAPLLLNYEKGLLTSDQFYAEVCTITGFCGTINEFAIAFGDIFAPIEPMIELQARLRQAGYPTYILSNTNELAVRHIRNQFPFFGNFDGYVLSYEVRSMKPDARIYEELEKMSGFSGGEILYLDDRPENVEAGALRNWNIILHKEPTQTLSQMQGMGMKGI